MSRPAVSAIVVSYHTGARLKECLFGLLADPDVSEIVIVDNGNPDEMQDWIGAFVSAHPSAKLITGHGNIGFGAAANKAVVHAAGPHLLIINPDAVLQGSRIWEGDWKKERAEAYGLAEDWRDQFREDRIAAREKRLIERLEETVDRLSKTRPELAGVKDNLKAERVDEGVRIELFDDLEQPMFRLGSAELNETVAPLLTQLAALVAEGEGKLLITGHTDGRPLRGRAGYDNWNLSSDRAHATRRASNFASSRH